MPFDDSVLRRRGWTGFWFRSFATAELGCRVDRARGRWGRKVRLRARSDMQLGFFRTLDKEGQNLMQEAG